MPLMRRTPLARRPMRRVRVVDPIPRAVREEVAARSGGRCERCSSELDVHLHHRLARSRGGQHTAENLVAACARCHCWIHDHPAEAVTEGWTIQRGKVAGVIAGERLMGRAG